MRKILLAQTREKAYQIAGETFQSMYFKVTGETLPIITQDDGESDLFVIGSDAVNDCTAELFAQMKIKSLRIRYGTDDYALCSAQMDERIFLVLAGGCGRSTLYAVYHYFEQAADCRYFWDGDVIPHRGNLPMEGFSVSRSPRFEYRGLRYFAHRGLHRFQAEHWSLRDWMREIDWLVKRKMNFFMLRIGMDDLFQRAFPDTVSYPDATKPFPEDEISWAKDPRKSGYDDRSLFWPLEYRGKLREAVLAYARDRGLLFPADCGTMTHWYSRTPLEYLDKKEPKLLGQVGDNYAQRNGFCWDPRVRENMENYFQLSETEYKTYNIPNLFHTIGLAERNILKDHDANLNLKCFTYRRIMQGIKERFPWAKMLIAAWDFLAWWKPEDVAQLLKELDPSNTLILDYTNDGEDPEHSFLNWGMVGKFPWIFGIFQAYERQSSIRGPYDMIRERLEVAKNDSFCKGLVFWPELSHSDTLALEYLARNSWQPEELCIESLVESFSKDRYGMYAHPMNDAWQAYLPMLKRFSWGGHSTREHSDPDYARYGEEWQRYGNYMSDMLNIGHLRGINQDTVTCWEYESKRQNEVWHNAAQTLSLLSQIPCEALANAFVLRDVVDIARSVLEQRIHHGIMRLLCEIEKFKQGNDNGEWMKKQMNALLTCMQDHLAVIGCHADYSMNCTMKALASVCPVNPAFEPTLKRNLVNGYCRQAAYEAEKGLFVQENEAYYAWVIKNIDENKREQWKWTLDETENELYAAFMETPLEALQPALDATILPDLLKNAAEHVKGIVLVC